MLELASPEIKRSILKEEYENFTISSKEPHPNLPQITMVEVAEYKYNELVR